MAKKKPAEETALVKVEPELPPPAEEKPKKKEKPYDPNAFQDLTCIVKSEYGDNPVVYTAHNLEELYTSACLFAEEAKQASCHHWMEKLKIPYPVAVVIMDKMEYRKFVEPIKYVDGVAESSGPRKLR